MPRLTVLAHLLNSHYERLSQSVYYKEDHEPLLDLWDRGKTLMKDVEDLIIEIEKKDGERLGYERNFLLEHFKEMKISGYMDLIKEAEN